MPQLGSLKLMAVRELTYRGSGVVVICARLQYVNDKTAEIRAGEETHAHTLHARLPHNLVSRILDHTNSLLQP